MSLIDKFLDFGDDVGVKLVEKAWSKQQRINALLEAKSSGVRIASFEIQMGMPPSVTFCLEPTASKNPNPDPV